MYIDGWMNDLDFYVTSMMYHRDSSVFFVKPQKKQFFQNCIKLLIFDFLEKINDF